MSNGYRSRAASATIVAVLVLLPLSLQAAWPEDPGLDLFLGDGPGEQTVPHVVALPDGGCYVGWYDNRSGNYDVALQRVDELGNEAWAHNGLLVSDEPQDSWVMDWDLQATEDGDAVVAVRDLRSGGNPSISVTRVTAAGAFPWGPDGITVAATPAFLGPPNLAVCGYGDVAVVWEEHPDTGAEAIRLQRVAPDGTLRYPAGGLAIHSSTTQSPGRPQVIAAGAVDVIVSWVINDVYMGNRQVAARKFDAAGNGVWAEPVQIFTAGSLPFGHNYTMLEDGAAGAVVGWEGSTGLAIHAYAQHLDTGGAPLMPIGGVRLSTDDTFSDVDPRYCYDPATGCVLGFWRKTNGDQNMFGISGQRLDPTGDRLWEPIGRTIVAVGARGIEFLGAALTPAGVTLVWVDSPGNVWGDELLTAVLVDGDGHAVWTPPTAPVSSTPSVKSSLVVVGFGDGSVRTIWKDERAGTPDIAAKKLNADGSLGGGIVPVLATPLELIDAAAGVTLGWTYHPQLFDGCHVYRRTAASEPRRIDDGLVASADGRVRFHDPAADVAPGSELFYAYALVADGVEVGRSEELAVVRGADALPRAARILGSQPNPFNPPTTLTIDLPQPGRAQLAVYDATGRRVRTLLQANLAAGTHAVVWDGRDDTGRPLASGIYEARLSTGRTVTGQKLALVK